MESIYFINELLSTLDNKLTIFERYLSTTQQIENVIAVAGSKELRQLFYDRRQCIKRIHHIDATINDTLHKIKTSKTRISPEIRERMNHYRKKIQTITDVIAALDNKVTIWAKTERNHIKNELLKLRKTRNATKVYGGKTGSSSRFLDTRN